MTQYITNVGISLDGYTNTHFNHHHRVLHLISIRKSVKHLYNSAIYVPAAQSKKSRFGILCSSSSSSFFSRPSAIVSYLLTLVYI